MAFLAVDGALHGLDGGLACAGNPGPPFVFFDLAEIKSNRRPDGAVEAILQPGNVPFVIDPATRMLRVGKEKRELSPSQFLVTPADLYLLLWNRQDADRVEVTGDRALLDLWRDKSAVVWS